MPVLPVPKEPSFTSVLSNDLDAAVAILKANDSDSNRRNAVRTAFAGIEGVFWTMNEAVYRARHRRGPLTHHERAAFEQRVHAINDQGVVSDRPNFVPLKTGLRFVAAQMRKLSDEFKMDTGGDGYRSLMATKAIRDRLIHPKKAEDLKVTAEEVGAAVVAFEWMMDTYVEVLMYIVDLPGPPADYTPPKMVPNDLLNVDKQSAMEGSLSKWQEATKRLTLAILEQTRQLTDLLP